MCIKENITPVDAIGPAPLGLINYGFCIAEMDLTVFNIYYIINNCWQFIAWFPTTIGHECLQTGNRI